MEERITVKIPSLERNTTFELEEIQCPVCSQPMQLRWSEFMLEPDNLLLWYHSTADCDFEKPAFRERLNS